MQDEKTTFGGIDLLRFLAAAMVMLFHYGFWVWAYPRGLTSRTAGPIEPHAAIGAFTDFGWVGVEIFFVISGFVIAFSAERSAPSRFLIARVRRLVPAVWFCAPISACVIMLLDVASDESAGLRLLSTVLFYPIRPWVDIVYWTLGIEIAFYAVVWALLTIGRFHWIEAIAALIGTASTLFWAAFHQFGWSALADNRALALLLVHHGCFFALGVMLWLMRFKGMSAARLVFSAVLLGGCLLQIAGMVQLHDAKIGEPTSLVVPVVVFVAAVLFMAASLRLELSWPGWRRIGMMTYPLYLLHNVVGAAILGGLCAAGTPYPLAIAIVCLAMIAASWIVAEQAEPRIRSVIDDLLALVRLRPA